MPHKISQAPATAVLCNRLYDKLDEIQDNIAGLADSDPRFNHLLVYSSVMGWCCDARALVMEIKSQL